MCFVDAIIQTIRQMSRKSNQRIIVDALHSQSGILIISGYHTRKFLHFDYTAVVHRSPVSRVLAC